MKVTDPEALELWRKLKKLAFSTVFIVAAIAVIGLGAIAVSGEIQALLASFGILFHYHIPEFVHRADVYAVVITLLIIIAFSVFAVIKDVLESLSSEKQHNIDHTHPDETLAPKEPQLISSQGRSTLEAIETSQNRELELRTGKGEGTLIPVLPVQSKNKPNKNLSRRRRRRRSLRKNWSRRKRR